MAIVHEHTVKAFDTDIDLLTQKIIQMGGLVETQLAGAIDALVRRDTELAMKVKHRDPEVDALEEEIDQHVIRLLAIRQPMAVDLRHIAMALKISNSLERTSDQAVNIAKRVPRLVEAHTMPPLYVIPRMGQICQGMIKEVLDAFVEQDSRRALAVWHRDAEVDALHDGIFRELITFILEDPRTTSACIDLMFIAKNLERIGDQCTNIAEKVHYIMHGEQINRQRS
jgi:phosphate transport system protein